MSKDSRKKVVRNNLAKAEQLARALAEGAAENTKFTAESEYYQSHLSLNTERSAYNEGYARATKSDSATVRLCHEAGVKAVEKQREKLVRDAANKRAKKAAEIAARKSEFLDTVVPRTEFVPLDHVHDIQEPGTPDTVEAGEALAPEVTELLQAQA